MAGTGRITDADMVPGMNVWYLKRSGIWRVLNDWRETGKKNKILWGYGLAYFFIFFVPLAIVGAWGPFHTQPDLEGLTLMILNPLAWAQTVLKFVGLWRGIANEARAMDLLKPDFLDCIPENRKEEASAILRKATLRANKVATMGIFVDFATCGYWNLLPLLRSEFMRETLGITIFGYTAPPGHNKISGYWFPMDVDSTPWTQIIYVYEFTCLNMAGCMIGIVEGMVVHLVYLFNAHTDVLSLLLEELKLSNGNLKQEELLGIIKGHQKLMRYGEILQDLFNFMITFQMSTGLLILIITIFNFFLNTKNVDLVLMLKMVVFLLYTFVEVTVYCYVGDLMEDTSQNVAFAAYCSEWYNKGVEFRKTVQMIMVRSQSPMVLKFGKMYAINLVALMGLVQCAYSTSMFMNNLSEQQESMKE